MRASLAALACLGFSRRAAAFAPAAPFVRRTTTARAPAVSAAAEEAPGPAAGSLESIAVQYQSAAQKGLALTPLKGNEMTNEVYTVNVRKEGGLGLVLAEMWAAGDGPGVVEASTRAERGLVLVEEIVEGSNAAAAVPAIEVGDTIIAVTSPKGGTVDTEGVNWDATVGALGGAGGDEITLMMKRLVPRATVTVKVTGSDGSDLGVFEAAAGSNLRMEFLRRGLPKDEIYDSQTMRFDAIGNAGSNCGGEGSCGTCLVAVTRGLELISQPGRIEGKALAKQNRPARWRWSCRAVLGANNQGGEIDIQMQPQVAFEEERSKSVGL